MISSAFSRAFHCRVQTEVRGPSGRIPCSLRISRTRGSASVNSLHGCRRGQSVSAFTVITVCRAFLQCPGSDTANASCHTHGRRCQIQERQSSAPPPGFHHPRHTHSPSPVRFFPFVPPAFHCTENLCRRRPSDSHKTQTAALSRNQTADCVPPVSVLFLNEKFFITVVTPSCAIPAC